MTRILILAGDVLPFPGYPTTGAGLRAWSIGQGLRHAGFEVAFSMPDCHLKTDCTDEERELSWNTLDRERPVRRFKPDVIVACHWPAMPARRLDIPIVLDLHGPHLMERCCWDVQKAREGITEKIDAFQKADFFVCAGERQRYYFFNWLMLAGFPLESSLIAVIPVSLSPDMPERRADLLAASGDPTIVYGGMFLPWQNPVYGLECLLEAMESSKRGHLRVFGGPHPIVTDKSGRFDELEKKLRAHPRVTLESPRPHDELLSIYLQAHLAFDLMEPNFERELAFTTRTVEYLWCGLPVVYGTYAELSSLIERSQAGWLLETTTPRAELIHSIADILLDSAELNRRSRHARTLVAENLTWDRTMKPLVDFCHHPRRAAPQTASLLPLTTGQSNGLTEKTFSDTIKERLRNLFRA